MSNCNNDYCEIEPVMLPCPFCGELPELHEMSGCFDGQQVSFYSVVCEACGIRHFPAETVKEALRRWNTRAKLD